MNKLLSFGKYALIVYWGICILIYSLVDVFLDLYADKDFINVFWYAGIIILPLAIFTIYVGRETFFKTWYTSIFFPLIIYAIYLGSAYFTALNLDLLMSASFKNTTEEVLPVKNVRRIFAGKSGFVRTDVTLYFQRKSLIFRGTRTSYFSLKPYKQIHVNVGRSYLGTYFITHLQMPAPYRWAARWAYLKDWFLRYVWLLVGLPIVFFLSLLKDKFFPAPAVKPKPSVSPYKTFFKRLLVILLTLFGLFMLAILLLGLFS